MRDWQKMVHQVYFYQSLFPKRERLLGKYARLFEKYARLTIRFSRELKTRRCLVHLVHDWCTILLWLCTKQLKVFQRLTHEKYAWCTIISRFHSSVSRQWWKGCRLFVHKTAELWTSSPGICMKPGNSCDITAFFPFFTQRFPSIRGKSGIFVPEFKLT